jgi:phage terminase small subunit
MPVLKNSKWERFAQKVATGDNETSAYSVVYEKDPTKGASRGSASRIRSNPIVAARITELQTEIAQSAVFTARDILLALKRLVFFDPRKLFHDDGKPKLISELDEDTACALQGIDIQEVLDGEGNFIGYTKKYKLADRGINVERAMKHLGLLVNKLDLTSGGKTLEQILAGSYEEKK